VARLASLHISNRPPREISPFLLPSCSQATYSVNTLTLTLRNKARVVSHPLLSHWAGGGPGGSFTLCAVRKNHQAISPGIGSPKSIAFGWLPVAISTKRTAAQTTYKVPQRTSRRRRNLGSRSVRSAVRTARHIIHASRVVTARTPMTLAAITFVGEFASIEQIIAVPSPLRRRGDYIAIGKVHT
jgi:hypothetical protein